MESKYPEHLAFIPDGCRRWARAKNLPVWEGHRRGIKLLEDLLVWFVETYPTRFITGYGLSIENFNRAKTQLEALSTIYSGHFKRVADDERIHKNGIRVQLLGRTDILPKKIREAAISAVEATKHHDKRVFNIALAYSGRAEVVDAVKKLGESGLEITEDGISKNLYQPGTPEPDMIFRTSEKRVSNFLLWQGAYAELYFLDKYWPDITREDIIVAMDDFAERQRRYGV